MYGEAVFLGLTDVDGRDDAVYAVYAGVPEFKVLVAVLDVDVGFFVVDVFFVRDVVFVGNNKLLKNSSPS